MRIVPISVSEASDEIWNGKSQFGPVNAGAVDTSIFTSSKVLSHLSIQMKSIFPISAYNGVAI